jgi:trehalose 2-sulfotransferase
MNDNNYDRFDQFKPVYDLKCDSASRSYYAVCATPRSGSHFLGHLMYSTGAMGYPLEYLHPIHIPRWSELAGSADITRVFEYIKSRRTSPNGCFGLKTYLTAIQDYPFDALFPACRLILIDRDDLLDQAISLVRARQTNQWISMHERKGEPRYDFQAIDDAITELLTQKASWLRFFAVSGREYLKVTYESLVADPAGTIGSIADYLLLPPVRINWETVLPRKQSDDESEIWRRRFRDEANGRRERGK